MECDINKLLNFLVKLNHSRNLYEFSDNGKGETSDRVHGNDEKLNKFKKCLEENQHCYSLLCIIESSFERVLEICKKKQKVLISKIEERCQSKRTWSSKRRSIREYASTPYFKDLSRFSHPFNADVCTREIKGYFKDKNLPRSRRWRECEKSILTDCIREEESEKWTQTLKYCRMLKKVDISKMSLAQLIESRYDEYDWLKFSVTNLNGARSAHECRTMWFSCLHPRLNHEIWGEEESIILRTLIRQYKSQNWDTIAKKLESNRSALQCICHFKRQMYRRSKCKWIDSEVLMLQKYVDSFHCKNYIPWINVKMFIEGRQLKEIFLIWCNLNRARNNRFSVEEDLIMVMGMKLFGNDCPRISEYISYRPSWQVSRRIETLNYHLFPTKPWLKEEDVLLQGLVKKYGFGNWLKISTYFVNRSSPSVRGRYLTLQKTDFNSKSNKLHFPLYQKDIVNIAGLWKSAKRICQENNICVNIDDLYSTSYSMHIMDQLSKILKSRNSKDILKKFLNVEYFDFFIGADLNKKPCFQRCKCHRSQQKEKYSMLNVILSLKMLKAEVHVPSLLEIDQDKTICDCDKSLITYLVKKRVPESKFYCDVFPVSNENNLRCDSEHQEHSRHSEFQYSFPPNFSTLLIMSSFIMNEENLITQAQGATNQVDNMELKHKYSVCGPISLFYSEKYERASSLWSERLYKLLGFDFVLSKIQSPTVKSENTMTVS